jgi:hypothetical protein
LELAVRTRVLRSCASALFAALAIASIAAAEGRNPGSLLVFPEFDSTSGHRTLITLTNANADPSGVPIRVEIVFVNGTGPAATLCTETNTTVILTPNDTLTFLASALNPNAQRGYLYAFAKDVQGRAISFNWLIGDDLMLDGVNNFDYSVEPYSFRALRALGQPTDIDNDGIRDLNGIEYEMAPAKILVPRFLGQSTTYASELVLINLTGGAQFTTMLDFLVYNDNEEVFSREFSFRCWSKTPLSTISGLFGQNFLSGFTNNDPAELIGNPTVETGWFEIDGGNAWSSSAQFPDPAFLAFLVERTGTRAGAELAFDMGKQANGDLLPLGLSGDSN